MIPNQIPAWGVILRMLKDRLLGKIKLLEV